MELTPEQLAEYERRATMAERNRCAKVAEGWLETFGAHKPEHVGAHKWATDAVRDIIDNIRNEA